MSTDSRVRACAASVWRCCWSANQLSRLPVLLGLGTQVVDGLIEEDFGELCAPILSRCATIGHCLKGLHESVGELIGGLVYLLLLLLVHDL